MRGMVSFFFFQAEDGIRDLTVTGVQTCALPICTIRTMPEDPEKSGGEPNLELPSLFGRGRKKRRRTEAPPTQAQEEVTTEDAPAPPGPTPVRGSTRRLPPTPPPAAPAEDTVPVPEPVSGTTPEPAEPAPLPPAPEPVPPVPAPVS